MGHQPSQTCDLTGIGAGKVALVHDWLTGMRGGEKCLEVLCELFPNADLFTLLHNPGSVSPTIENRVIHTSFIQRLPRASAGYRRYLPLFPTAIERLDLGAYDLILSSSHCVAKGIRPKAGALHLCYCYTPMRYVWDQFDAYFGRGRANGLTRAAAHAVRPYLQHWDVRSAGRVDHFMAISRTVQERIQRHYGRTSEIIYPPVQVSDFTPQPDAIEDWFLVVSALSGYKRIDLAIEAVRQAGARLKIVGGGPDLQRLQTLAQGANVEFLPWQNADALANLYAHSRALLFPGTEDFGITPLESMASGRPVIALASGGALETVIPQTTGVLVDSLDPSVWADVLREFNESNFDAEKLRGHATSFDRKLFKNNLRRAIEGHWREHRGVVG